MQTSQYHIFSLPPELLESLTPRNLVNRAPSRKSTPEPVASVSKSGPRACNICQGVIFLDLNEQRVHFRSDWHRYNVKTRLNGGQTVTESNFSNLIDGTFAGPSRDPPFSTLYYMFSGLEDSLSGSESSDDDDDSDAVNILLNRTKRLTSRSPSPNRINSPRTALSWFHSPPSTQIGIYRSILPLHTETDAYLKELRMMQSPVPDGRRWAMFMIAGGHFAGAVVRVGRLDDEDVTNEKGRQNKPKRPKPDTEVLRHKTFHRYTSKS